MKSRASYEQLKKVCIDWGADLFGVADISKEKKNFNLPAKLTKKLNQAISLGAGISHAVLSDIKNAPTKLYFHHYRTANMFLDQLAFRICNWLQARGYKAIPIPASQILDWQAQNAHLSHKRIGYLAGLGWIGRNNLLINEKLGSSFRLVTVLTDLKLPTGKLQEFSCCSCKSCIKACPVGAVKQDPEKFDHARCFEKLKEFQKKGIVGQYICGICIRACPVGIRK